MIAILLMALCVFTFKDMNMLAELQVYAVFFVIMGANNKETTKQQNNKTTFGFVLAYS